MELTCDNNIEKHRRRLLFSIASSKCNYMPMHVPLISSVTVSVPGNNKPMIAPRGALKEWSPSRSRERFLSRHMRQCNYNSRLVSWVHNSYKLITWYRNLRQSTDLNRTEYLHPTTPHSPPSRNRLEHAQLRYSGDGKNWRLFNEFIFDHYPSTVFPATTPWHCLLTGYMVWRKRCSSKRIRSTNRALNTKRVELY